jgi:WhiB family redox-sensing transcriptional regulator
MSADDYAWQSYALCAQMDADLWHLSPQMGGKYTEAKSYCRTCPVIRSCRAYALACEWGLPASERRGVWGGMTAKERVRAEAAVRAQRGESVAA